MDSPTIETFGHHIFWFHLWPPDRWGSHLAMSVPAAKLSGVDKVDVMEARKGLHGSVGQRRPARVTHAPYRREPYVRVQDPHIGTVDAKAAAWTRTQVLLHWIDEDGRAHNEWVLATGVRRITRAQSAWQDPYDEDC